MLSSGSVSVNRKRAMPAALAPITERKVSALPGRVFTKVEPAAAPLHAKLDRAFVFTQRHAERDAQHRMAFR